ncbi:MAG: MFS transporter [Rhizobiaceae bacterium]|nr:MFS transporter [Rhizobiaceae bacterium]
MSDTELMEAEASDEARPFMVLFAAMTGIMLVSLDVSVVNVAVESLQSTFRVPLEELQWVLNAYTLSYATFLLSAGALSDRIGARATFLWGFAIFLVASLVCGAAPNFLILTLARVGQGLGAALLVPSAMALLQRAFPESRDRAKAVGLWAGSGSLAIAAGPLVGGALISLVGWRTIFLMNVPVGVVGIWLTLRHGPALIARVKRDFDLAGQFTAAAALACLTAAVSHADVAGSGPWIAAGLVIAALFTAAFFYIESSVRQPMVPLGLFRNTGFTVAAFAGFVLNFVFYGMIFVFSLFFQSVQGKSAFATGVAFVPMSAVIMVVNVAAGRLAARFGVRPTMIVGLLLASVGFAATLLIGADSSVFVVAPAFMVSGAGIALAIPSVMAATLAYADPKSVGIASGVVNAARQVGGAIGVALFSAILGTAAGADFVSDMHLTSILSVAGLLAAAAAVILVMPTLHHAENMPVTGMADH